MEAYCLSVLFRQPETYYMVNRRMREVLEKNMDKAHIAKYRQVMIDGPLTDWNAEDFRQVDGRALMQLFLDGLNQDDLAALDYVANAGEIRYSRRLM